MEEAELSVLIVDDSPIIYKRLKILLKEVENVKSILYAGSFQEAEQILRRGGVNIVLLDIRLPDKNGFDLLKIIKKEYPFIKVIMITNLVDDHYRKLCKKLKADHFIDKSKDFRLIPGLITDR